MTRTTVVTNRTRVLCLVVLLTAHGICQAEPGGSAHGLPASPQPSATDAVNSPWLKPGFSLDEQLELQLARLSAIDAAAHGPRTQPTAQTHEESLIPTPHSAGAIWRHNQW